MNFLKFQLKWKILKDFMRSKHWAALRKLFRLYRGSGNTGEVVDKLWHKHFSVNFTKFLRTTFLQNTSEWLLLSDGKYQTMLPNISCFSKKFVFVWIKVERSVTGNLSKNSTCLEHALYLLFDWDFVRH